MRGNDRYHYYLSLHLIDLTFELLPPFTIAISLYFICKIWLLCIIIEASHFSLHIDGTFIEFIYSGKATKFCEILLLTAVHTAKSTGKISQENKHLWVLCFPLQKYFQPLCDKLCWLALVSRHNICSIMLACSTYFV